MQADLLKYLDQRLPRYTSYPTAIQFGSDVDAEVYERWLAALPADEPISIYIHVPFCAELCLYCGCHTTVARHYAPIAAYVDLLAREISLIGDITGRRSVSHIHWGGGTPTILTAQDFSRVMAALHAHFMIMPRAEVAIEIDPRTLTRQHVAALAAAGITRASLGVQDFEICVQQAVRRLQSFDQTAHAADWLRDADVTSISFDLMYGLPHQTVSTVTKTAERTLPLEPDRIALFGYAHVPWMKRHQRLISQQALPGSSERFAQSRAAAEVFIATGYQPIGLDHFAKSSDLLARRQREGKLHRNFQGYTTDESTTVLGFGTSAIGTLPDGYVQNASSTLAYRDAINRGRPATVRGRALTEDDRIRRHIIERLMCDLHVDLDQVRAAHAGSAEDFAAEYLQLDNLAQDDLVQRTGHKISVPESKRHFVRVVSAVFDAYLPNTTARYSPAS
jgi:oxygen-independent coproporphyrinogen-3 oxidase